jgi:hypothetical protein
MKRLALVALALALGLGGAAYAQTITKSLQGSQDPRGPVGLDTSLNAYLPGHINAFGNTGVVSPANCGAGLETGVVGTGSTDVAGFITPQSSSCQVYFGTAFNAAPSCITQTQSIPVATALSTYITTATTGFNLSGVISGTIVNYICIGNK